MADVIDLSTLKHNEPSLDSLSTEQQEALAAMAEENEPQGEQVRTAFLVVISRDGTTVAVPDINLPLVLDHAANADEMYGAVKTVAKDIKVEEIAQHTAMFMQQLAMATMQARQNAQMAQQLGLNK